MTQQRSQKKSTIGAKVIVYGANEKEILQYLDSLKIPGILIYFDSWTTPENELQKSPKKKITIREALQSLLSSTISFLKKDESREQEKQLYLFKN